VSGDRRAGSEQMTERDAVLECVQMQTTAEPTAAVIWLHGLGADGFDFVPVVRELEALGAPSPRYVFPHAPMRPVTINNGFVMRAWYDIRTADLGHREDEAGIRASQAAVERLIERETARGVPRRRIVLAGFSQGAAITLQTGLRQAEPLAGLIALSGYLPLAEALAVERHAASDAVPLLMAHGKDDPVVPIARAIRSRDLLGSLGYRVQWHEYPMEHSVCAEELEAIARFLRERLA
jgi:phospholipase/carboxylesterase